MPAAATTVYLVRHGETDWNASGRWQGHTDVPLNAAGEEQSRRLARRLVREQVRLDALFASDLARAFRTAAILGEALGVAPVPEPGLREIDVGRWAGLTAEEAAALDAEVLARIHAGEDLPRGGAERFAELQARAGAAFDRLVARRPGATLALVSHGGPTRAILRHALPGRRELQTLRLRVGNASLTVLRGGPGRWELALLDDLSHLEAAPRAPDMMAPAQGPGEPA